MKIKTYFHAPFGVVPALRLSHVPRWAIINVSKQQSVAEHSFNVAVIVRYLCGVMGLSSPRTNECMADAIYHDLDEVWTSDIPTPAKEKEKRPRHTENLVVKLADVIESIRFIQVYCLEPTVTKLWIMNEMTKKVTVMLEKMGIDYNDIKLLLEELK